MDLTPPRKFSQRIYTIHEIGATAPQKSGKLSPMCKQWWRWLSWWWWWCNAGRQSFSCQTEELFKRLWGI